LRGLGAVCGWPPVEVISPTEGVRYASRHRNVLSGVTALGTDHHHYPVLVVSLVCYIRPSSRLQQSSDFGFTKVREGPPM
jgi:hypothetical protein